MILNNTMIGIVLCLLTPVIHAQQDTINEYCTVISYTGAQGYRAVKMKENLKTGEIQTLGRNSGFYSQENDPGEHGEPLSAALTRIKKCKNFLPKNNSNCYIEFDPGERDEDQAYVVRNGAGYRMSPMIGKEQATEVFWQIFRAGLCSGIGS